MCPFGKWPNFNACVTDMMGAPNNYDEETAKKTCGKLQARLEGKELFRILKAKGSRRVVAQYVAVEGLDREGDIIPNHRLKEALEDLKSRDPRYQNVNWRHTGWQIGHPLWTFTDEYGDIHKTEVDEYGLWGITEIRNDGYRMADKIWNQILTGEPMGASIGVENPQGRMYPIRLTKDEIQKRKLPNEWEGAKYWDIPLTFIEPWSLTSNPANQYVTAAQILAKDICEPCVETRAKWYIQKGLFREDQYDEALAHARSFYIKYVEKQQRSDEERAKQHFNITDEQWNELSPEEKQEFISKLPPLGTGRIEKQDEQPPKDWWDACIANVEGADKAAVCGHIFHHVLGGDRSRADPSMFTKEANLLKLFKMSWEECIAEARNNPDVQDPEALCGWLRFYGPHGEKKELELSKSMKCVGEEIMQKYWKT